MCPGCGSLQHRVVVGRARRLHRAQRHAVDVAGEQPGPDEPVGLVGRLLEAVLLHQGTENIRHRFAERPRLEEVCEPRFVFGYTVPQFVTDHIQQDSETVQQLAGTVVEDQTLAM